jgi:hypothetical protein
LQHLPLAQHSLPATLTLLTPEQHGDFGERHSVQGSLALPLALLMPSNLLIGQPPSQPPPLPATKYVPAKPTTSAAATARRPLQHIIISQTEKGAFRIYRMIMDPISRFQWKMGNGVLLEYGDRLGVQAVAHDPHTPSRG